MDQSYRLTAKGIGYSPDKLARDDFTQLLIEKGRTHSSWYFWTFLCARWEAMEGRLKHTRMSAFLYCSDLCSFLHTTLLQSYRTLLVDIFLDNPGTAAASGNILRCGLSALGLALIQPLINGLGRG